MSTPDLLRALLTAPGPSGYETAPAAVLQEQASAWCEVTTDNIGSVYGRVKGTAAGPTLALVGHIDEIGLIVTHISDEGFLHFIGVGGWDGQILVGQRCELITRAGAIPGVLGKKPIHLIKPDEREKAAKLSDLHIDIGAKDGDEARGLVRIGDVAVISGDPVELPNGRVISRSMDNRLGTYVAFEAARLVAEAGGAPGDVVAVGVLDAQQAAGQPIAASRYSGTAGVPAYFAREMLPLLLRIEPAEGCKRLLREHAQATTLVDCPAAATDVDTPRDWTRLLASRLAGGAIGVP